MTMSVFEGVLLTHPLGWRGPDIIRTTLVVFGSFCTKVHKGPQGLVTVLPPRNAPVVTL